MFELEAEIAESVAIKARHVKTPQTLSNEMQKCCSSHKRPVSNVLTLSTNYTLLKSELRVPIHDDAINGRRSDPSMDVWIKSGSRVEFSAVAV